jgi:hypothetical protein
MSNANGNGTFKGYANSYIMASTQKAFDSGAALSTAWITMQDKKVAAIGFDKYATRLKTHPAFDALNLKTRENAE